MRLSEIQLLNYSRQDRKRIGQWLVNDAFGGYGVFMGTTPKEILEYVVVREKEKGNFWCPDHDTWEKEELPPCHPDFTPAEYDAKAPHRGDGGEQQKKFGSEQGQGGEGDGQSKKEKIAALIEKATKVITTPEYPSGERSPFFNTHGDGEQKIIDKSQDAITTDKHWGFFVNEKGECFVSPPKDGKKVGELDSAPSQQVAQMLKNAKRVVTPNKQEAGVFYVAEGHPITKHQMNGKPRGLEHFKGEHAVTTKNGATFGVDNEGNVYNGNRKIGELDTKQQQQGDGQKQQQGQGSGQQQQQGSGSKKEWIIKLLNRCPECGTEHLKSEKRPGPKPTDETLFLEYAENECGCKVLESLLKAPQPRKDLRT